MWSTFHPGLVHLREPPQRLRGDAGAMVVRRRHEAAFGGAVGVIAVGALGGYLGGWARTGFRGNTLWDWLHLLVLPVVLALLPLWLRTRSRLEMVWLLAFAVPGPGFL